MATQKDGKIVVGGYTVVPGKNPYLALARFNTDGSLDTSFGLDGRVMSYFPEGAYCSGLIILPDGRIVAAGYTFQSGALVAVFDRTDGHRLGYKVTEPGAVNYIRAIALQPQDQKIVVAGEADWGGVMVARFRLDGDTPEVFDQVFRFVKESGLYEVQITFLTPFPGTPLYKRLQREGRLIHDRAWELCTLFDINVRPRHMSIEQLQNGFLALAKRLYSAEETAERRRNFKTRLKASPHFGRCPQKPSLRVAA